MQTMQFTYESTLNLLQLRSESLNIWSAIIRINTEGKSLIMKLGRVKHSSWTYCITDYIEFNVCKKHLNNYLFPLCWHLRVYLFLTSTYILIFVK